MRKTFISLAIAVLAMIATSALAVTATVFEDNYADYCNTNSVTDKTDATHTASELKIGSTALYAISYGEAINSNVYVGNRTGWQLRNSSKKYLGLSNSYAGYIAIAGCKAGDKIEIALSSASSTPTDAQNCSMGETTSSWTYNVDDSHQIEHTVYTLTVTADGLAGAYIAKGSYIGKITVTREVSSTTLTAGGNGYTAYSSTSNFTVTGATAYYVKQGDASGSSVSLTEISSGSVIPASQGIILKEENKDDQITVNYTSDNATTLEDNLLKPVLTATQAFETTGTNYVLATTTDGETAFYKTTNADATWTALQGKCYLNVPTSNAAKLNVFIGGTTGINGIDYANHKSQSSNLKTQITYNLAGQRVGKGYKGIVIINGKKYINR